ncbi:MAG: SPOR domain-containing protein [Candidatus Marinimicrobia bacterium]|nr:SPOR domain-containing protein [Candidatus Neomarinimicrobiota bacterium]
MRTRGFPQRSSYAGEAAEHLYLVRIGAYEGYQEAKQALLSLKEQYPSEEGIVVKVAKE